METFNPGTNIGSYKIVRVENFARVGGQYIELIHEPTGARHIHIACADDNNAFLVVFPTVPTDSTGVAHILEHVVLAGSERYPVRDPFFAMGPRSLATFMNALTFPDMTAYPFSTRNQKDFFNLLSVYLDACFFPAMDEPTFRQEGWRYEFSTPEDTNSQLEYKGVVFNEMKGAMSNISSVVWRSLLRGLYPDTTYANNSGGDPRHIPDLSWSQLRQFHAEHYHPSNAFFYTYGNLPLLDTLARIETEALQKFKRIEVHTSIANQKRFSTPKRFEEFYPIAPSEDSDKKTQVLVAWLAGQTRDSFQMLAWRILERVLLANASSRLRQALIESKLGDALADATGFGDDPKEAFFSAGLKGVRDTDVDAVEKLVLETLQAVADEGLDSGAVEAAIHRMELDSREVSNSGWPFGFKIFFELSNGYVRQGDPFAGLQFDADIKKLRSEMAAGQFFENLIRNNILLNQHRVTLVMRPDKNMQARMDEAELANLKTQQAQLSPDAAKQIVSDTAALKTRQESEEDRSVLPGLELADIPAAFEDVQYTLVSGTDKAMPELGLFAQPTNGIVYLDFQFNTQYLEANELELLPILAFVLPRMGGGDSSYLEMAARIEANTGGVGMGAGFKVAPNNLEQFASTFSVSAKALARKTEELFAVLHDLLLKPKFDSAHLSNLLAQYKSGQESSVVSNGHAYAIQLAAAQLSSVAALRERFEGLSQVALAKRLAACSDAEVQALVGQLEKLVSKIFDQNSLRICLTAETESLKDVQVFTQKLIAQFPNTVRIAAAATPAMPKHPQARSIAAPVAYDAKVWRTVELEHPDSAVLLVLSKFLRERYLHPEIREKGGAYGGFAIFSAETGNFVMASYRDPHIVRTFKAFEGALEFMNHDITPEVLKESILEAYKGLDPLLSPDSKGRAKFFNDQLGYTLAKRQEYKRRLLAVTTEDLRRVAKQYLNENSALAVVSGESKIEQANIEMGGIFEVQAV